MAPPSALVPTVTLVRTEIRQAASSGGGERIAEKPEIVDAFGRRKEEEESETATRGAMATVLCCRIDGLGKKREEGRKEELERKIK